MVQSGAKQADSMELVRTGQPAREGQNSAGQPKLAAQDSLPEQQSFDDFVEALNSAKRLLAYASESGIEVEEKTRDGILEASRMPISAWTPAIVADFLSALTKLSARLKPVTAESLKACNKDAKRTVSGYYVVAICLAAVIVPVSVATFITSAISNAIRSDITTANQLAVKLGTQLPPPGSVPPAATEAAGSGSSATQPPLPPGLSTVDVITELQSFASTMRAIDTRSRQLNWFILRSEKDPFAGLRGDQVKIKEKLQLKVPLPLDEVGLADVANDRITVYQDVRSFGQGAVDDVSVFYGSLTVCILPVLYALLGTCAYLLRSFEREMSNRTFIPSHADSPRFLIAGIGGAVVGLFNNFVINQSVSIPPLAIAFLVGYGVDVFFSFLEGLIQAFTKSKSGASVPSTGASS